jgi:hypothetical protein
MRRIVGRRSSGRSFGYGFVSFATIIRHLILP